MSVTNAPAGGHPRAVEGCAAHDVLRRLMAAPFAAFVIAACGGIVVGSGDAGDVTNADAGSGDDDRIIREFEAGTPDARSPPDAGPPPSVACDGGVCAIPPSKCANYWWQVDYSGGACVNGKCSFTQTFKYCAVDSYSCCANGHCRRCQGPE